MLLACFAQAQVTVSNGPELENDRDNKMNRLIAADDNNFYCYRVRTKGRGTSFFIEKYDSKKLKPLFTKEINLDREDDYKLEDIYFAMGNVYIFRRLYDKKADKMTLSYQTVSSDGKVAPQPKEIMSVNSDHYEFVDFDISMNPGKTRFLVKCAHKPEKDADYTTDFTLLNINNGLEKVWNKNIKRKLSSNSEYSYGFWGFGSFKRDVFFLGLLLDNSDNVYYAFMEQDQDPKEKKKKAVYTLNMGFLASDKPTDQVVPLLFDDEYISGDIMFSKNDNSNQIMVGGFMKDIVERKGRDLVNCGIFNFTVDLSKLAVASRTVKIFDPKLLTALESSIKKAKNFNYKLDYMIPSGKDMYYIGEQYDVTMVTQRTSSGMTYTYWQYEYMDVIVAKLNEKGEFEWITNAPLRNNMRLDYPHVFKQYIAVPTANSIYILRNDHPKNMKLYAERSFDPRDLKSVTGIHGSSFMGSVISLKDGSIKNSQVFENESYCFAPIQERHPRYVPPSDAEIFVPAGSNEIILYTEDRGRDRFTRLKLTE